MPASWLRAQPNCLFDQPHLRIDYKPSDDSATGFILDRTNSGDPRRYLYEASFRDEAWRLTLTAADPANKNSFWDRDGPAKSIRVLAGMQRNSRKDLRGELASKLARFRTRVLETEDVYRKRARLGRRLESLNDRARYFLHEATLIRIQTTIVREFVQAIELPDASVETAMTFVP